MNIPNQNQQGYQSPAQPQGIIQPQNPPTPGGLAQPPVAPRNPYTPGQPQPPHSTNPHVAGMMTNNTKHSTLGKFAFFWSIVSLAFYLIGFIAVIGMIFKASQTSDPEQLMVGLGAGAIALVIGFIGCLVGLVLSIIGVCQNNVKKVLPITSLCLTGGVILLQLFGMVVKN